VPFAPSLSIKRDAVVTDPFTIEDNHWIGCVHHTVGAHLIWSIVHFLVFPEGSSSLVVGNNRGRKAIKERVELARYEQNPRTSLAIRPGRLDPGDEGFGHRAPAPTLVSASSSVALHRP
jgi:hypothetical protein